MSIPPLYGLDLNPSVGARAHTDQIRIISVGLSTDAGDEHFQGDEGEILHLLDHRIALLPPGVLVTWQGSILDFPLLVSRSRRHGFETGIRLRSDHRPAPPSLLTDVDHPFCSDWYSHRHLELRRFYDASGRWWNPQQSKRQAGSLGEASVATDPCRFARLGRVLARRRWDQAAPFIDRMPPPANWTPPVEEAAFHQRGASGNVYALPS